MTPITIGAFVGAVDAPGDVVAPGAVVPDGCVEVVPVDAGFELPHAATAKATTAKPPNNICLFTRPPFSAAAANAPRMTKM
jgi:hypothetical protein